MPNDHHLARLLADEAGGLLLALRRDVTLGDPAALRAAGDARSNAELLRRLAQLAPGDRVLSEESADDPARLGAERVWIIDPLDGTREFGEIPRVDWAVHVALWSAGRLVAGAVAQPAAGRTYATDTPQVVPPRPVGSPWRFAVSRTRPPRFVAELAQRLDAQLVPMGSAGVKAMSVLTGECDAYVHAGGPFEWDSAAPVAVALAAGLHASRIDGSPLRYNQPDPSLPDLIVCRPELADELLGCVSDLLEPSRSRTGSRSSDRHLARLEELTA